MVWFALVPADIIGRAEDLSMPDDSVDFVIANHVLEHMQYPIRALLRQSLGGQCAVSPAVSWLRGRALVRRGGRPPGRMPVVHELSHDRNHCVSPTPGVACVTHVDTWAARINGRERRWGQPVGDYRR